LPVHVAKTVATYIQEKGEWAFDIRAETSFDPGMDDNAGKSFFIQRKVTPSQPVTKPLGYLALQPAKIGKLIQDHGSKLR